MISTLDTLWRRLEAWVRQNADAPLRLRPGVAEADLSAAEADLGFALPPELRAFLRVHDGQDVTDDDLDIFAWMPGCAPLASLEAIVAEWRVERLQNEQSYAGHHPLVVSRGRLHHFLWHPRRIPIAGAPLWGSERTFVDLFPGPEGRAGQVVTFVNGIELALLGPSLAHALQLHVEALESGEWVYSATERRVVPTEKRWATGWLRYVEAKLYALAPAPSRPGFMPMPPASRPGFAPMPPPSRPGFMPIPPASRPGFAPVPAPSRPGRLPGPRGEPGSD